VTRQFLSFGVVGTIGFLVDAGVLILAINYLGLELFFSRLLSFSVAVTVTWYLNRKHTFENQSNRHALNEWVYYSALNSVGALINLSIFMWLVIQYEYLHENPIAPLAIASAIAMVFNFLMSRFVVFQGSRD